VPLVSKRWDGHASDTAIFKERAEAFVTTLARSETPRYLGADAQLSSEDTAATLAQLGLSTRIPATLKWVSQVIRQALQWDTWHALDDTPRSQRSARWGTLTWPHVGSWCPLRRPWSGRTSALPTPSSGNAQR
jgi:hypothetical protein